MTTSITIEFDPDLKAKYNGEEKPDYRVAEVFMVCCDCGLAHDTYLQS